MVFLSMVGGSLREGGTYDLVHAQDTGKREILVSEWGDSISGRSKEGSLRICVLKKFKK